VSLDGYSDLCFKERGRDRDGVDCWGLVCMYYKDVFNLNLQDHLDCYETTKDPSIVERMSEQIGDPWVDVLAPKQGDVVLCRMASRPMHVGVYIDGGFMLHIESGNSPVLEKIKCLKWTKRIAGFYRHKALA